MNRFECKNGHVRYSALDSLQECPECGGAIDITTWQEPKLPDEGRASLKAMQEQALKDPLFVRLMRALEQMRKE